MASQVVQAEIKIGVVSIPSLVANSPQFVAATKRLKKEVALKERQLLAQQKAIKKLEEKLARDGLTMTDTEKRKIERDIISKSRDGQRAQQEFKEDITIRRNEDLEKMRNRIKEAVKSLAIEGNYDLILTEGVFHASKAVDVTDKVQAKLTSIP